MCGIAGFVDFQKDTTSDELARMSETLRHRGPDGHGQVVFSTPFADVGFAHQRLKIIDLTEGGSQPMQYKHFWITFNGEVYNYQEIRQQLRAAGHQFTSNSDTEVILHSFAEWGEECVHRFRGMFAFVIFNTQSNLITLCRDRAGVKPLYYTWQDGLFLFGSELKVLMRHRKFNKGLNHHAIASFMQLGYIPEHQSVFLQTHKVLPGHIVTLSLENRQISKKKYWDVAHFYSLPKQSLSFQEACIQGESILEEAFQLRMVADVPVGLFLSGGYDSTCAAALIQKNNAQKLQTFTIGVHDNKLDEAVYARKISKMLGTEHTEIYCSPGDALSMMEELPYFYDEPFGDSSALPTMLVCKLANQQVKVALSADGGDEIFAGYNRYDIQHQWGWVFSLPQGVRKQLLRALHVIPTKQIFRIAENPLWKYRFEKMKLILNDTRPNSLMINLTHQFFTKDLQKLFVQDVEDASAIFEQTVLREHTDMISWMMAVDFQTYLPGDILQKVDRAGMHTGLETRDPFLDHYIIEWASRLPTQYKYQKGNKKRILKEIVHRYIPEEIMRRPKMGFAVPVSTWLKDDLKHVLDTYLNEKTIRQQGIFNWESIRYYKLAFLHNRDEFTLKIWFLLMFQMWYKRWME